MRDPNNPCLFCAPRGVTRRNALAYATRDSYPVNPGHTLILPLRHCGDFFDLSREEVAACMEAERLPRPHPPDPPLPGGSPAPSGGRTAGHPRQGSLPAEWGGLGECPKGRET